MKNRILCVVLAISLLAAVFVALPARGAIEYTGSVRPMDNTGHSKDAWFANDHLYVNVSLYLRGTLAVGDIRVEIQYPDGSIATTLWGTTDLPVTGYYNSTQDPAYVHVPGPSGPVGVFYVVAYEDSSDTLLASVPITVRQQSLTMTPVASSSSPYYPGEEVTITWITTHSTDLFYMHIINETGVTFVNWSRQITTVDGWWSAVWKIDANMPDGTYRIRARSETTHATLTPLPDKNFPVQKYVLSVEPERTHYMPGETAKITYLVYETSTFMPYPGVTITFSSDWLNSSGNTTWLNSSLAGDNGIQEFVIPTNIALYSDINITYWANESSRSAEKKIVLVLDQLSATLSMNPGPYMPRDTVVATVTARVGPDLLSGAAVVIHVQRNGTDLPAYAAENLTTDLQGVANHPFTLADASPQDGYIVTVVVTKAGYTVTKMASFYVVWDGELTVQFDKLYYFSGDTASVSFKAVWNNQLIENPSIGYQVFTSSTLLSTGNTSGADISVTIPSDFSGTLSVEAKANHEGNILSDDADVTVYMARIVLTPAVTHYGPGDTVTFNYDVITGLTSASLSYKITDAGDVNVASDDLAGMSGSFDFIVPIEHPSNSYTAMVTLTDDGGRYVTTTAEVNILADHALKIWTGKSGYTSGQFKPGQTVKVHYSISSYVQEDRPVYIIVVYDSWSEAHSKYQVTAASGELSYKLPADTPNGEIGIWGQLWDGVLVPPGNHLSDDYTKVVVNSQLSGWDKGIAGMSASDFTILVLIIIMILLLIVMPFLKSRMEAPKAPKPEPIPPPTPEMPKTP